MFETQVEINKIKERMLAAGVSEAEAAELLQPIQDEFNRRVVGLVWKHQNSSIPDMDGKLPILKPVPTKNITGGTQNNVLIEGDNLFALMAMQYTHIDQQTKKGKIDVIYIDPPYNTESTDFTYNDNFEKSEWLSMMNIRLKLARNLMADHGTIFMSIDEHYQAELKLLCDDIFGAKNYLGTIHWRRRHNQPNDKNKLIAVVSEFIFVYAKDSAKLKTYGVGKIPLTGKYTNPDNDPKGPWTTTPWKSSGSQSGCTYTITTPTGKVYTEEWLGTQQTYEEHLRNGRIHFPKNGDGVPRKKIYKAERILEGQCASNWWNWEDYGCNQDATDMLKNIFHTDASIFDNPKPVKLIARIIGLGCVNRDATVLDFFAGSGTTGQAVMELNKEDGGHRTFILCTNNEIGKKKRKELEKNGVEEGSEQWIESGICRSITQPRIKTIIEGVRTDGTQYKGTTPDGTPYSGGLKENNLYYFETSNENIISGIDELTRNRMAKQAVSYISLKENVFNPVENDEYHILSSHDTEIAVIINPNLTVTDIQEELLDNMFTKAIKKVYCSTHKEYEENGIVYIPYPTQVLAVLKAAKKYIRREM